MATEKRKSKARIEQSALLPPNPTPSPLIDRDEWINNASTGFITSSKANQEIYRVILETLWPKGHGIPGPVIDRDAIREAVNTAKGKQYLDVFRRLRELQGEEGFLGIVKQGNQHQLIDTNIYPKKTPRTHLSDDNWSKVLLHYGNVCAACGNAPDEKGFQQDHKVPRSRGGTDALTNWQPLCDSCNNIKSTACRGCKEDCSKCSWAYPEYYRPIKIQGSVLRLLHQYASAQGKDANALVTEWIMEKINKQ